jgi:titin
MNGTAGSAYSNVAPNIADPGVPTVPVAPTGFTVAIAGGVATLNWSHPGGASLVDFTIQRANNARFTLGVSSLTAAAGATTAQDPVPTAGPYYYRIRANGSAGSSAWTNASPFPVLGPLTIVSLTANQTFPFTPDGTTSITWTVNTTGGTGPLQYEFYRYAYATGSWTTVQTYGTSKTYTWTPGPTESGSYSIVVWVKNAGSAAAWDAYFVAPFELGALQPVVINALTPNVSLPAPAGTPMTWTATATGGAALLYEFHVYSYGTGLWSVPQTYSPSNMFTWNPGPSPAGQYAVVVWVRSTASAAAYDAYMVTAFFVTP